MNIDNLLKDFQTILVSNSASALVYREQLAPENPTRSGYVLWDFNTEYFGECSDHLTNTVEGSLDVTCYSTNDTTRSSITTAILDLFVPVDGTTGKRTGIGPVQLTNCFLNCVRLAGHQELFPEKGSHPIPESIGTFLTFKIKAQIVE